VGLPEDLEERKQVTANKMVELVISYAHMTVGSGEFNSDNIPGSDFKIGRSPTFAARAMVHHLLRVKREDVLFRDVWNLYTASDRVGELLDALEPFVLADRLATLPPEVMQAMVSRHAAAGKLARIERCVLH